MKIAHIAALIISAATLNAFAQDAAPDVAYQSDRCSKGLAGDERFAAIADKVALKHAGDRYASEEEGAALAVWHRLRKQCFEAGTHDRRKVLSAQRQAALQSAFIFQQVLLSRLQQGEITYGDFNRRSAELSESFDPRL